MLAEPGPLHRSLIEALIDAPVAWQTAGELSRLTGTDLDAVEDLLADLDTLGWLDTWDREDGPAVTLTVSAAEQLGVRLVEYGRSEIPRWARRDDPEPPAPVASHVCRDPRAAALETVIDPGPGPEEIVASREARPLPQESAPTRPGAPPRELPLPPPTIFLGVNLTPWPGPARLNEGPCPSCGTRELSPRTYCICCDRWGLDAALAQRIAAPRVRATPEEPAAARRVAKLARRERRRERFRQEEKSAGRKRPTAARPTA